MKKFILIYSGGGMPASEEEGKQVLAKWNEWMGNLGSDLVDGGFAFMPGAQVTDGKTASPSTVGLSGYTVIAAADYAAALQIAMTSPAIMGGSMVHVMEEMPMPGM